MKQFLQYHGRADKKYYFTIVTDDETGLNMQGIDIKFSHFIYNLDDKTFKRINYMQVPTFQDEPDGNSMLALRSIVTRAFSPFIPYNIPFYEMGNGHD